MVALQYINSSCYMTVDFVAVVILVTSMNVICCRVTCAHQSKVRDEEALHWTSETYLSPFLPPLLTLFLRAFFVIEYLLQALVLVCNVMVMCIHVVGVHCITLFL